MSETIRKWQDGGRWAQQKGVACAKNAYEDPDWNILRVRDLPRT